VRLLPPGATLADPDGDEYAHDRDGDQRLRDRAENAAVSD
jgi:hypothetical protein